MWVESDIKTNWIFTNCGRICETQMIFPLSRKFLEESEYEQKFQENKTEMVNQLFSHSRPVKMLPHFKSQSPIHTQHVYTMLQNMQYCFLHRTHSHTDGCIGGKQASTCGPGKLTDDCSSSWAAYRSCLMFSQKEAQRDAEQTLSPL